MSKYRKLETLTAMKETGIVPVFFNNNVEIAQNVVKACYEGGIRAFEFTNRGDFAIEVFKELSKFVLAECPGLILGAGTILDTPTAALYIQMGANFIVSPSLNPEAPDCATDTGFLTPLDAEASPRSATRRNSAVTS